MSKAKVRKFVLEIKKRDGKWGKRNKGIVL